MNVINWVLGAALWIAGLLEKLIKLGLSLWAYAVGLLCMGLVLILHWVAFTIGKEIPGLHARILGYAGDDAGHQFLTWGLLAALLFAVATWSYSQKYWRTLSLAGAVLLLVCLSSLLQVAYGMPALLKDLADEEANWVTMQRFQTRFLPSTLRLEESNSTGPQIASSIQTVWDRLVAARYFMGMGWYLTVVVGLLSFFYALPRLVRVDRSRLIKGSLLMAACLCAVFIARAAAAHVLVTWGQVAEARGQGQLAIERYRRAMRLDRWFAIHTDLYQRIGQIDATHGRSETVDYGIYLSELWFSQGNFIEGIAELERVIPKSGSLAPVLVQRESEMWESYGSSLYNQHAIAAAIPAWQSALAKDPKAWSAGFGLTRAYFEMGRYDESAALGQKLLKNVRDPVLIAELESDVGDALLRLGDVGKAHLFYRSSYLIDFVYNWRALSALVGAQSDISLEDTDAPIRNVKNP